ncbi:Flocculation suppression protein [Tilletia horrida]|nr:Flocculation suppression protein [Tilletia horrida]
MSGPAPIDRSGVRKHPQDPLSDDERKEPFSKRAKHAHNPDPPEGSAAYSASHHHPSRRGHSQDSPETERRSRSPAAKHPDESSQRNSTQYGTRSPPSSRFSQRAHPTAPRAKYATDEHISSARPPPMASTGEAEHTSLARTSAADAFRSVRGVDMRDRDSSQGEASSDLRSSRQHPRFSPISPSVASGSMNRPRVSSNASDRSGRFASDRGRGNTLPSIRAPRSPGFSPALRSPEPPSTGYSARLMPPPPGVEGASSSPASSSLLPPPPPSGYQRGLPPPLVHRRTDGPTYTQGSERPGIGPSVLPPVGPPSSRYDQEHNNHAHHIPPRPIRSESFSGPPGHSSTSTLSMLSPNKEGAPPPPPPLLPPPGAAYDPDKSMGMLPLAYSNHGSDAPGPSGQGIPGSLSSLGSQLGSERRSAKQQPSFVNKLYSMLEDHRISNMISWAPSGTVFSVANPSVFSKVVLPQWFKHSNWQSFVRQLNMYGFNKVNQTFQGEPSEEVQVWEFRHPRFRRGEVHLLNDIKRKNSRQKRPNSPTQSFSGGDQESRRDPSATPSPEMSSFSMDDHARMASSDIRYRTDDYPYGSLPGPSTMPGSSVAHTGMPFPHEPVHTGPGAPPPASFAAPSGGPPAAHVHINAVEGEHPFSAGLREQGHRLNDVSDRIDAIIRHSNYLEAQLRAVSERLHQSQQAEQAVSIHMARTLELLIHLGSSVTEEHEHGRSSAGEEARLSMLAACRAELDAIRQHVPFDAPAAPHPPNHHAAGHPAAPSGPHQYTGQANHEHAGRYEQGEGIKAL